MSSNRSDGIPAGGWITSEVARAHVQELRHQNDALLVGAGTILSDNPMLTDRSGRPRRRPLLRVILDSRLRLPVESRLVQSAAAETKKRCARLLLRSRTSRRKLNSKNLESALRRFPRVIPTAVPTCPPFCAASANWKSLRVMIEGGATVNWTALAANVVDKFFFTTRRKFSAAPARFPLRTGNRIPHMNQAAQVKHIRLHRFGEDFAVEGYLRDPVRGINLFTTESQGAERARNRK